MQRNSGRKDYSVFGDLKITSVVWFKREGKKREKEEKGARPHKVLKVILII